MRKALTEKPAPAKIEPEEALNLIRNAVIGFGKLRKSGRIELHFDEIGRLAGADKFEKLF